MRSSMYEEGLAKVRAGKGVFINPMARLSRDASVAFAKLVAGEETRILDATAATGIRGIRYYLETKAKDITLLDMNKSAFRSVKANLKLNGVKARALGTSVQEFANTTDERFDIIDLDPFGGVTPYVADLLKIAKSGGYLTATATDTAVLCGASAKACRRLYDARPLHNELCHEVGLRILAGFIAREAGRFGYGVEVLMALSHMHYMRVFVKLEKGSKKAMESLAHMGYVYYCNKCYYRSFGESFFPKATTCGACGSQVEVSGKMWMGSMENDAIVRGTLAMLHSIGAEKATLKVFDVLAEEPDFPLYYSVPKFTKKLGIGSVSPAAVLDGLRKRGFKASTTHMEKSCIRTDAGMREFEDALSSARMMD